MWPRRMSVILACKITILLILVTYLFVFLRFYWDDPSKQSTSYSVEMSAATNEIHGGAAGESVLPARDADAGGGGDTDLPTLYEYYAGGATGGAGLEAGPGGFTLNGRNISLHSGAMHYFRVPPQYWRDRLRRMRAAGLNAVETYVPWNLHNPAPGVYDFGEGGAPWSPWLDIVGFVRAAQAEDLLVLVRPGPYICAEWEFGGLPAWLLRDPDMQVRTSNGAYTRAVRAYYGRLLPLLAPLHWSRGGGVVALQIENEYGAFGVDDKPYLALLRDLMLEHGLPGLFFTSDSPAGTGDAGALPGVLQTANFQSDPEKELDALRALQPDKPFMVMEYWTGWFDHWTEEHHTRTTEAFADVLQRILAYPSSVNFYMFHGGSNWGFMNGANSQAAFPTYQPDVTSYDYDAPLTEAGDYSPKWQAAAELLAEYQSVRTRIPDAPAPLPRTAHAPAPLAAKLTLHELLSQVPAGQRARAAEVQPMERLAVNDGAGQALGFVLYRREGARVPANATLTLRGRVRDVAVVLLDGRRATPALRTPDQFQGFGYWEQRDASMRVPEDFNGADTLDILVENWGRVNYGRPDDFRQFKGLVGGPVEVNGAPLADWEMVALQFDAPWLAGLQGWAAPGEAGELSTPTLFRVQLDLTETADTWLDMRGWGKGAVFVNGFPLGRHFHLGPTHSIYLPAPLLKQGSNEILIFELFETPGELRFSDKPILGNNEDISPNDD